ncbi:hypothetical protein EXIGLDRAFT_747253 [Exidia glandulosa HHB12029]|uniref:F-box domain-containing protein n=1 Tax=Exidia glandulosa HHB12029 TaxID=1314781 RepID=A0A165KYX5_EXIGL|nr:hypothetical protein EXIGLDRAFT_747253 [Exidia glandulosa HHB12029]
MPSDVDTKLQDLVHESLTRVCADAQLDRLRFTYVAHIAAIQATFRAFAFSVNAVAPVNRLPPDVLLEILAWLPCSALVKASHVCSYWRSTALASATLWSSIILDVTHGKTDQLVGFLRRAKNAPTSVAVRFRGTLRQTKAALSALLLHTHHMKALDIFLGGDGKEVGVRFDGLKLEIPPSPPMESLIVRSYIWRDCIYVELSSAHGSFGSLRRLYLGATLLSSFALLPDLPSLTDLRFQVGKTYRGSPFDFKSLEDALRKCPLLSRLVISDMPYDGLDDPNRSINLPNLRHLGLAGYVDRLESMRMMLKFLSSFNVQHVSMYGYALEGSFSQALDFVIEEDTPNVVDAYITRYSAPPGIQYDSPFYGRDDETSFSLRAVDNRKFTRTLYCLPNPRDVITGYSTTLQRLFVDVQSWRHLLASTSVTLVALEDLFIFGDPFWIIGLHQVAPLRVPSVKNITIYIVSHQPEEWNAEDVQEFLDKQITDFTSPLETLRLYGGEFDLDCWDLAQEAELNASYLVDVRSALQDRANVLDIRNGKLRRVRIPFSSAEAYWLS